MINKQGKSISLVKPSKAQQERGYTGQKSVTNKYTKVLAGVDDFDNNPPQIHVQGISSATNKIKKSFNFDTSASGVIAPQDISSIDK